MADPITIAALGATAGGAILGAVGKEDQASAQAAQANYQAGVAQVNAALAKQDANYSLEAGGVQQQQAGMREGAAIGQTKAAFGASNIAGGSKSSVVASEIEVGQSNQGIIEANAAKRAYGYEVGAASDTAQAGALRAGAQADITAGNIGAASSILGGVGSVSSKWLQMDPAFGKPDLTTDSGIGVES